MEMVITVKVKLAEGEEFGREAFDSLRQSVETGQDKRISFRYLIAMGDKIVPVVP